MRLLVATAALVCALAAPLRADDPAFPYTAYINADDVYVRSGPGKNYYPTSKLAYGEPVEIYRHDPGGWYAIRPPEGSFSWVSAELLQPTEDNYAEITGDRVMSRVGSDFSDIRDVIQVRLYRGEEVEIIESKRFGDGPAAQTWCKIAPPSGEFRWVYGKFVDHEPPGSRRRGDDYRQNLLIKDDRPSEDERYTSGPDREVAIPDAAVQQTAAQRDMARSTDDRDAEYGDLPRDRLDTRLAADRHHEMSRGDREGDARRPAASFDEPPGGLSFYEEIEEIDLALSLMVSEEPTVWKFDSLRGRAESLLSRAETAVERGKARRLLTRMDRFEDIRDRYTTIASVAAGTDRLQRQLDDAARVQGLAGSRGTLERQYDGTGRLTRVLSPKLGAPRYALLDSSGAVRYYVTPSPGVNLQHYTGREVGLSGSLGYLPDLDAQHLTAKRVQVIEGGNRLR